MSKKNPLRWVLRRIRRRIPMMVLMTVVQIINAFFSVVFALGTKSVIDSAISGDRTAFLRACLTQAFIILGILVTLIFNRHMTEKLRADLDRDWKRDMLHGLLHGDFAQISTYHSGELLNRLNNDVRTLNNDILTILPNLASMITRLITAMAVLVSIEPWLSLIVVLAGIAVVLITNIMRRKLKGLNKRVSEEEGRVSGFLQETLEKLLAVQAMDVSEEIERRADVLMADRYELQRKHKNASLLANACTSVLSYGAAFGALIWGAGGLLNGTMTYGTLTAITQLVSQLQVPFMHLSGVIPHYVAMLASAERLMELATLCGEPVPEKVTPEELYERMESIGADGLCFAYDRDRVFNEASFNLPKGEFGVIVGHSGIGKSTLLKLMLGVFHPGSGELFVQTREGRVPLDRATRRLFAYVPQGNLLISGTLRENLTITRPEATEEEIQRAIHISGMDDYLPSLPQGLETVLGESALGLSEGQAQRLSIARAVLSQAPILLLDEATSALDAQTEELVLKRLCEAGKTCIAVTHRPAAIELSDWSLEMRDGKCILHRR